jgi:hypothetical protein
MDELKVEREVGAAEIPPVIRDEPLQRQIDLADENAFFVRFRKR